MVTFEDVKNNKEINTLILDSQKQLDALGYTEHSMRHITIVSNRAAEVLKELGYDEHRIELARIAGYMHDIGNVVNRVDHAHSGAILAYEILKEMGMNIDDRTEIMMAIGNHDEATGTAVSDISAALILADKSDVHRNRVRNQNMSTFDKHDKVNYAVTNADFILNKEERKVTLNLTIDREICPVLDYFEIFMDRTMMSKYAAKYLNIWFELVINGTKLL
ncbi:MAG: HD domain-containing protein [Clostridia bacterium]